MAADSQISASGYVTEPHTATSSRLHLHCCPDAMQSTGLAQRKCEAVQKQQSETERLGTGHIAQIV